MVRVLLWVDKGPNAGTRFELPLYSYRAVGRAGGGEVTVQLSEGGDRPLDPDDRKRVEAHLQNRKAPSRDAAESMRFGAYRRGRDVLLDDDKISRTHAMFFFDDEGPSVVDLRSTNGTHVNGQRVGDADLSDGDIVNLGKTRFVVQILDEE